MFPHIPQACYIFLLFHECIVLQIYMNMNSLYKILIFEKADSGIACILQYMCIALVIYDVSLHCLHKEFSIPIHPGKRSVYHCHRWQGSIFKRLSLPQTSLWSF